MTIGVQTFVGARLREARLARGLFMKSLGDMIGVTGPAIARYEEGIDKPQAARFAALADQLKFPAEFFTRAAWPEEIETVFWRSRASETKAAREMTEQRMRWLCELFAFLEAEVDFPSLRLPELDLPEDFRLYTAELIERAADQVRAQWKLRDLPIPDVILALENVGIPVVNLDMMSDKQDGFCFTSRCLHRSFVGINTHDVSAARARFDAAHELGHLVLHRNVGPAQSRDPVTHRILEQQAHRFAGAFIFPRTAFMNEFGAMSLDYFCDRKRKWGMSIAAMIFRAWDLGLIDDAERMALYQRMVRRRWRGRLREPFDSEAEMPLERPRMIRRGVEAVVRESVFSRSAIRAGLALPTHEIEQLAGLEQGYLNEGEVVELARIKPRSPGIAALDLETGNVVEFPQRRAI